MVLDQAPWHRSWRVKQYQEAHPEIELIWLAAYTPELNPVELVWKLLKGRVVKGRYFARPGGTEAGHPEVLRLPV
jgi:transposase